MYDDMQASLHNVPCESETINPTYIVLMQCPLYLIALSGCTSFFSIICVTQRITY